MIVSATERVSGGVSPGDVRRTRESLGMTQQEVAETLNYRQGTIAKFESGYIPVSRHFVQKWNEKFLLKLGEVDTINGKSSNMWKGHLQIPLSADCSARIEFNGHVTQTAMRKLIRHLEMTVDVFYD